MAEKEVTFFDVANYVLYMDHGRFLFVDKNHEPLTLPRLWQVACSFAVEVFGMGDDKIVQWQMFVDCLFPLVKKGALIVNTTTSKEGGYYLNLTSAYCDDYKKSLSSTKKDENILDIPRTVIKEYYSFIGDRITKELEYNSQIRKNKYTDIVEKTMLMDINRKSQ